MKVFNTLSSDHAIRIIPSQYVTQAKMTILHELTGETWTINLNCTRTFGYLLAPFSFQFKEAANYELTVTTLAGDVIYRGKAYATAQGDLQNYKITE